jgi:hypothetical protein
MVPCGAGVSRQTTPLHKVLPRQARARELSLDRPHLFTRSCHVRPALARFAVKLELWKAELHAWPIPMIMVPNIMVVLHDCVSGFEALQFGEQFCPSFANV